MFVAFFEDSSNDPTYSAAFGHNKLWPPPSHHKHLFLLKDSQHIHGIVQP